MAPRTAGCTRLSRCFSTAVDNVIQQIGQINDPNQRGAATLTFDSQHLARIDCSSKALWVGRTHVAAIVCGSPVAVGPSMGESGARRFRAASWYSNDENHLVGATEFDDRSVPMRPVSRQSRVVNRR